MWRRVSWDNGKWDERCGRSFHGKLEDEVRDLGEGFTWYE